MYAQIHTSPWTLVSAEQGDEAVKEYMWWFKSLMLSVTTPEGRAKILYFFDVSGYNLRQASKVARWRLACWLHLFFWSFKPVFSGLFINSGCQTQSPIWKIVQPSAPMFALSQSATWNSVFTVSDSAFANQNTQLGHRVENVDVRKLPWAIQNRARKENWCLPQRP